MRALAGLSALVCMVCVCTSCVAPRRSGSKTRVIVIGVDGMDPGFVERHWKDLPNLRQLRETGGFRRLRTTTPPQSPVAWSTFITGMEPSGHGIYDFVHRDPATRAPYSSMDRTEPPRFQVPIGPWLIPISSARTTTLRRGTPFWKPLTESGTGAMLMRLPTNYPPVIAGKAIGGMGVPDLRGGFGTFTFYTEDPEEISRSVSGGSIVKVQVENGRAVLPLVGPPNTLRRDGQSVSVQVIVDVDPDTRGARIEVGDVKYVIQQGEWSEWLSVEFALVPHLAQVRGMVRFYAKQLAPHLQLYASPVNLDPRDPALRISEPKGYSAEVAESIGPFFTQGIAEDTAAMRAGVLTREEYLQQSDLVFRDEVRMLNYAVTHQQSGLVFAYISAIDQNSHMLWGKYEQDLLQTYRKVDDVIGSVLRAAAGATVIVMSDHGFTDFKKGFQLNAWLVEQGFLRLKGPPAGEGFANVDWTQTVAYGLGLNALYLNQRGREGGGIVTESERPVVLRRLRDALLAVRDPDTGEQVIKSVSMPTPSATAPDMIVGYSPRYRASWDTALGATAGPVLDTNHDSWIGDHCVDADAVPGVLLTNRPIRSSDPELRALPSSILKLFGADAPKAMEATSIF